VLAIAEALERGAVDGRLARALSGVWARTVGRAVARPIDWPPHVRVVAVGGATLGGSCKTPLAIACAVELAAAGARTTLVGHAYRAKPRHPRLVASDDPIDLVGDEALVAARALRPIGVPVVVAPTRAAAIALAAREADVLVLDGVAQTAPARASLALLSVDAAEPWGCASALPPRGDLRASLTALLDECDVVVPVADGPRVEVPGAQSLALPGREVLPARAESRGAWVDDGSLLTWDRLRSARVGLFLALARPDRVLRSLARRGVHPRVVVRVRDHGPLSRRAGSTMRRATDVDLWLATAKCAFYVPRGLTAPLAALEHTVGLSLALRSRLSRLAMP
jgi:tetraacyldisaccharide-1-P 4'-kinase